MSTAAEIRVLVVDDHPVVLQGITAAIDYQPDMKVVGKATNGIEAVALFREHRPNVTLMDLRMPEMDGVAAIAAIRQEIPGARIMALTTYDGDEDIYRSLQAGACGYLLKGTPMEEILTAIRTVHRGQKVIQAGVAAKLTERFNSTELSKRELEVLRLMAQGASNKAIAASLFIVEGTVKSHVTSILEKLNADDRTHAVTMALQRGILHLE